MTDDFTMLIKVRALEFMGPMSKFFIEAIDRSEADRMAMRVSLLLLLDHCEPKTVADAHAAARAERDIRTELGR